MNRTLSNGTMVDMLGPLVRNILAQPSDPTEALRAILITLQCPTLRLSAVTSSVSWFVHGNERASSSSVSTDITAESIVFQTHEGTFVRVFSDGSTDTTPVDCQRNPHTGFVRFVRKDTGGHFHLGLCSLARDLTILRESPSLRESTSW